MMQLSFISVLLVAISLAIGVAQTGNNTFISTNSTMNSIQSNVTGITPTWLNSSTDELDKFMNDSYNYYVTPKGNKVWSCAMDLAWNQMKRAFLSGNNATFQNITVLQQKIVNNYNSQRFTKDQISGDSYYVGSGYGLSAQSKINFQIRQKFPTKMFPPLQYELKDNDFIVYSYFQKAFQFETPFAQAPYFKFKGVLVDAFMYLTAKQRKQLYYKYYNSQSDFLMGIKTANKNQEILLLKTNRTEFQNIRIDKMVQWIKMYDLLPNYNLKKIDEFAMPVLKFDYTRVLTEMDELVFANPEAFRAKIKNMQERLQMKLDRFGVRVYNDAAIPILGTGFYLDSKYFILNKDFWIILKEKNKKPHLIVNVKAVNETWNNNY